MRRIAPQSAALRRIVLELKSREGHEETKETQ
jgi:hypothetical protein